MCWNFHLKLPSQSRRNEYFNFPPDDEFDCLEIIFLKIFRNIVDVVRWMCCIFDELMAPCHRNFFVDFGCQLIVSSWGKIHYKVKRLWRVGGRSKKYFHWITLNPFGFDVVSAIFGHMWSTQRLSIGGKNWIKLLAAEWKAQGNQWAGKGKLDNSTEADCRAAEVGQVQIRICITRTAYRTLFQWNIHSFGAGSDLIFHQIQLFHWI